MTLDRKKLGYRLRQLRRACDLTQKQVAQEAGVSVSYVSMAENGRRDVGLKFLESLAHLFDVEVWQLLYLGQPIAKENKAAYAIGEVFSDFLDDVADLD